MTPQREVATFVDRAVAELDAATLGDDFSSPSTSSWASIVRTWKRFKALVDRLDVAVAEPLTPRAVATLRTAHRLTEDDAYRLAFWLPHVASAIIGQRRK